MARDRDPFGLAHSRLREALRDGVIGPGQPLIAAELAEEFKISATPVREALSRLAGEGMVEDRRWRGFYARNPTVHEILELYVMHHAYLKLALEIDEPNVPLHPIEDPHPARGKELRARTERVFNAVVQRTHGGMIQGFHRRAADQLGLIRLIEPLVLDDVEGELVDLEARIQRPPAEIGRLAHLYHERRIAAVQTISAKLFETFPGARL